MAKLCLDYGRRGASLEQEAGVSVAEGVALCARGSRHCSMRSRFRGAVLRNEEGSTNREE